MPAEHEHQQSTISVSSHSPPPTQTFMLTSLAQTCRTAISRSKHSLNLSRRSFQSSCSRPVMHGTDVETSANSRMSNGDATAGSKSYNKLNDEVTPAQNLSEQCARIHRRVYDFLEQKPRNERIGQVQRMTRESLAVIAEALERYTLDELSFSYNGGKDCLVLLILYLAALHSLHSQTEPLPPTLRSVYIVSKNPFPAVTSFVTSSSQHYHLQLSYYHKPMREAFASYLSDTPQVKAIFVGTRRTDPHGGSLTHFDMTDGGWPRFMRIHPVIDWHYADIWGFIRELGVEYCELYDMGYTSLGGTDDTHPNPALEVGNGKYRPAYELVEDEEERLGRDR